jgi:hypothetical protein
MRPIWWGNDAGFEIELVLVSWRPEPSDILFSMNGALEIFESGKMSYEGEESVTFRVNSQECDLGL